MPDHTNLPFGVLEFPQPMTPGQAGLRAHRAESSTNHRDYSPAPRRQASKPRLRPGKAGSTGALPCHQGALPLRRIPPSGMTPPGFNSTLAVPLWSRCFSLVPGTPSLSPHSVPLPPLCVDFRCMGHGCSSSTYLPFLSACVCDRDCHSVLQFFPTPEPVCPFSVLFASHRVGDAGLPG